MGSLTSRITATATEPTAASSTAPAAASLQWRTRVCSLGETYFYSTIGKVAHGIKISSHFYSAFVILIVLSKEFREKFVRIFESIKIIHGISWLGRQSFFVYLSHMLVIPIANKICKGGGAIWPAKWLVTLVLCAIISLIIKRLFNEKINYFLGN